MLDREQRGIDLIAHLQLVAPVDKNDSPVGEHDRGARRAGEGGQPDKPFLRGRDILALVPIGARHDEAVEILPLQFGPQSREPGGARATLA